MSTEPIAVEAERVPQRALSVVHEPTQATGPMWAIARMDDAEFGASLAMMVKGRQRVQEVQRAMMKPEVHYGVIPGTNGKPTLLQPGAQVLCQMYRIVPDFRHDISYGNDHASPAVSVVTRCDMHVGDLSGPVVAVGSGSCNSWERKYRYRRGERICPKCQRAAIVKGKPEYGGGWLCFAKKGGCGAKWANGAVEIEDQVVGDILNDDPHDQANTYLKMAAKRAFVDATIRATATSDLFTQDVEDMAPPDDTPPPAAPREAAPVKAPNHRGAAIAYLREVGVGVEKPSELRPTLAALLGRALGTDEKLTDADWQAVLVAARAKFSPPDEPEAQ